MIPNGQLEVVELVRYSLNCSHSMTTMIDSYAMEVFSRVSHFRFAVRVSLERFRLQLVPRLLPLLQLQLLLLLLFQHAVAPNHGCGFGFSAQLREDSCVMVMDVSPFDVVVVAVGGDVA